MTLDDETLAMLGWGQELETDRMPSFQRAVPKPPRPPEPARFDGRSKRNWRHRNMPANGPSRPSSAKVTSGETQ